MPQTSEEPQSEEPQIASVGSLRRSVGAALRHLRAIYRIDLALEAERFLVEPELVRQLLPAPRPRSGLLVVEEPDEAWVGLYLDPFDRADPDAIVEETSHLLCVAWHAAEERTVSRLILELQGEIDRYAVAHFEGRDAFRHFREFAWDDWMDVASRHRYAAAHRRGLRYCRRLAERYPRRVDTPGLLAELRRFYRAPSEEKLQLAAG